MGYYARLFLVETSVSGEDSIQVSTTVLESVGDTSKQPYFSWISGSGRHKLRPYGGGTIYSSAILEPIAGYPVVDEQIPAKNPGGVLFIRAGFNPPNSLDATVCHVVLPKRFVPRRDLDPLVQPEHPYVNVYNDCFVLTWGIRGEFNIEFCATPLSQRENVSDFDISNVLRRGDVRRPEMGVEVNLLFLKFKFGPRSA